MWNDTTSEASASRGRSYFRIPSSPHSLISSLQRSHPDIPETDRRARIAVRLEHDRRGAVRGVLRQADVGRVAAELEVILHQDVVVQRGDVGRRVERTVRLEL